MVVFVVVFLFCHVALVISQFRCVNWKLSKQKGMTIALFVWGQYRKPYTHIFVKNQCLPLLIFLDRMRWCSFGLAVGSYGLLLVFEFLI
jgi:hypothetical protein